MAGLRQGRADHESTERLGGCQARRAASCRTMLDSRLPGRAEGPLRALSALLLVHLELLQEQGIGKEPADRPVEASGDREDGDREQRLRPAGLREADDAQGLGGGRAAEGYALPLSEPLQTPDPVDRGLAGAAQDRAADLLAGDADQDVPALPPGRSDGKDARLGGRRMRRFHAKLRQPIPLRRPAGWRAAVAYPRSPRTPAARSKRSLHFENESREEDASWLTSHCSRTALPQRNRRENAPVCGRRSSANRPRRS